MIFIIFGTFRMDLIVIECRLLCFVVQIISVPKFQSKIQIVLTTKCYYEKIKPALHFVPAAFTLGVLLGSERFVHLQRYDRCPP
jgi:hypothetical protein